MNLLLAAALSAQILIRHVTVVDVEHARAIPDQAIVTAANSFLTAPIARMIGVEYLLASDPEIADGEYTGKIAGIPCFHEGKIQKLDGWLESRGETLSDFPESYFYGDSQSDVPLMEKVTHPVVVGPDEALGRIAKARNWPVISLQ